MIQGFQYEFVENNGRAASATLSADRRYRYLLERTWGEGGRCGFLMFNPSTADEMIDDPTIRKCKGFARRWGFGGIVVFNLFGIRSSDPRDVARRAATEGATSPIGPDNDFYILRETHSLDLLVCAWGCSDHMRGTLRKRSSELLQRIRTAAPELPVVCLGRSQDGSPRHPLMLAYKTPREKFEVTA